MGGTSKIFVAVFLCLAGIAAGAGCCTGTSCQTPNCRPQPPTPPPTPPPQPGWQPIGPGCCPDTPCGGIKYYFGILDGGLPACEAKCSGVGGKYVNVWTNDPRYCACYGQCDCSQGDSQTNCQ